MSVPAAFLGLSSIPLQIFTNRTFTHSNGDGAFINVQITCTIPHQPTNTARNTPQKGNQFKLMSAKLNLQKIFNLWNWVNAIELSYPFDVSCSVVLCCVAEKTLKAEKCLMENKTFQFASQSSLFIRYSFSPFAFFYFLFFARASKEETENFTQHQRLCFFHFIGSWNLLTVLILILFSSPFPSLHLLLIDGELSTDERAGILAEQQNFLFRS